MAITVNLCYTGRNGNALRFVEEMTNSASVVSCRRGGNSATFEIMNQLRYHSLAHDRRAVPWKEERRECLMAGRNPQSLIFRALWAFFVFGNMVL